MAFGSVNVPGDLSGYQRKLTGLPGQAVVFDDAGDAAAGQSWSNPNLLVNWYFADPINQRGQTEYPNDWSYSIDRWSLPGGVAMTLHDGYISVYGSAGGGAALDQKFEELPPGTYTVSILYADGTLHTGTRYFDGNTENGYQQIGQPGAIMYYAGSWGVRIQPYGNQPIPLNMVAAKLELGDRQTLARQGADGKWVLNDPPPNKALELAKCQRYFYRMEGHITGDGNVSFPLFVGTVYRPNQVDGMITFPVTMAKNPAFSYECDGFIFAYHMDGVHHNCDNMVAFLATPYGALMRAETDGEDDLLDLGSAFIEAYCKNFHLDFDANL